MVRMQVEGGCADLSGLLGLMPGMNLRHVMVGWGYLSLIYKPCTIEPRMSDVHPDKSDHVGLTCTSPLQTTLRPRWTNVYIPTSSFGISSFYQSLMYSIAALHSAPRGTPKSIIFQKIYHASPTNKNILKNTEQTAFENMKEWVLSSPFLGTITRDILHAQGQDVAKFSSWNSIANDTVLQERILTHTFRGAGNGHAYDELKNTMKGRSRQSIPADVNRIIRTYLTEEFDSHTKPISLIMMEYLFQMCGVRILLYTEVQDTWEKFYSSARDGNHSTLTFRMAVKGGQFYSPLVDDGDVKPLKTDNKLLNNRYELGDELGAGVSSRVFMAMDHKTNTNVAIKCYESWDTCDVHFRCVM
jgi:hypothetical protein